MQLYQFQPTTNKFLLSNMASNENIIIIISIIVIINIIISIIISIMESCLHPFLHQMCQNQSKKAGIMI